MRRPPAWISDHPAIRRRGAATGLAVAGLFLVVGLAGVSSDRVVLFLEQGIPTLVAGLAGGWLLAPRAGRAVTRWDWLGVVLRLGIVAVVIGAFGIGAGSGVESGLRSGVGPVQLLLTGLAAGVILGLIGIALFGWILLPVTSLAAVVWALAMAWARHLDRARQRS